MVFPTEDRVATGLNSGDIALVALELDDGYRKVNIPPPLEAALKTNKLSNIFHDLIYSRRKEYARLVTDAKTDETKNWRIA